MATGGFVRMCNSSSALVGFSWTEVNALSGVASWKYQAVDSSVVQTSRPAGWEPCCSTESGALFYPMFTIADDPTSHVGWLWLQRNLDSGGAVVQQYVTVAGAVTSVTPSGWKVGACGSTSSGGGGGGGTVVASVPDCAQLMLFSSMVRVAKYPDWGISALADADRKAKLIVPPGYDAGDWVSLSVVLEHVTAALTADFVIALLDLTNSITVATITIPAGTAPTNGEIYRSIPIGAGSFVDNTNIQWSITGVEDGNAFGCQAWGCYNLVVSTAS